NVIMKNPESGKPMPGPLPGEPFPPGTGRPRPHSKCR
ncbi:MAG: hypothetical protein UU07_C0030G0009, partial [Parcubacteria group bacterium GW2011_GWF1_40_5]